MLHVLIVFLFHVRHIHWLNYLMCPSFSEACKSFKCDGLKQRNIEDMQDGGSSGSKLDTTGLDEHFKILNL